MEQPPSGQPVATTQAAPSPTNHADRPATGEFSAPDGLSLVWRSWSPEGEAAAVLAVVHGYGEHGGRYGFLVEAMVQRGYAVCTYDLRGHGLSPGRRGHVDRSTDYVADTRAYLATVERAYPETPVVLLGHSMGGLIAAGYAEQEGATLPGGRELAGLVLSSPFMGMRLPVSSLQVRLARVLSRIAPTTAMKNPLRNDQLSHDPAVVAAAAADPLNHRVTTVRWAAETFAAMPATIAAADRIRLPLLLLYADDDPIADPRAAEAFFGRAASPDKTRCRYVGYFHEIFNEIGKEQVFADLAAWLVERVPAAAPRASAREHLVDPA